MLSRTKNSTQKYAGARPSIRKYCRCYINRLRLRPRPDRSRGATGGRVIVVVIVNNARGGRSRLPRRCICGLSPSPRAILLPDSSDANNKVRIAPGSGRRGIAPTVGGANAFFAPALVLLPLLAMPLLGSVAAAAAATTTTIKNKGNGGSGGSLAAAWPRC